MTPEKISESLQHLDDTLIEEADLLRRKKTTAPIWMKVLAVAACLTLICTVAFRFLPQNSPIISPISSQEDPVSSLPGETVFEGAQVPSSGQEEASSPTDGVNQPFQLTLAENGGAMGFEGYMAYDISEIVSANPWTPDTVLESLPVYRTTTQYEVGGKPLNPDFDRMEAFLYELAEKLGIRKEELTVETNEPDEEYKQKVKEKFSAIGETVPEGFFNPTCLYGRTDNVEIMVEPGLAARIKWDPPVELPDTYRFGWTSSFQEKELSAGYLQKEFAELIDMKEPVLNITGGDYLLPSDGQTAPYPQFNVNFYDGSGDIVTDILNFNFNCIYFSGDENDDLWLVWVYRQDLSEFFADYPIITWQQAQQMLCEGKYFTTVPEAMPGADYVKKVELIYREGVDFLIPYYRFYVEVPSWERDNGLKTYGAYYVPAVPEEYLADPQWGGWFN
ncbi:MAG: hypothetical protein IJE98_06460 [Oscillospiraceae bacterium]|nr:hypothetical protein [Oscillospiraceae bacterium]